MNTSDRFACRLVRLWTSFRGERASVSGIGARHIEHCPACQRHFAAERALTCTLRADAVRGAADAPAGLDQRIMTAIAQSNQRRSSRSRSVTRPFALAFAGSGIAVAAFVAVLSLRNGEPSRPELVFPIANPPVHASGSERQPGTDANAAAPVLAALQQDPLQTEAESVYAEAKGALQFLALNFLVTTTSGPAQAGTSPRAGG